MRTPALCVLLLALAACGADAPQAEEPPAVREFSGSPSPIDFNELQQNPTFKDDEEPARAFVNDERFHRALLDAVRNYAKDYGNLDDIMRWAPGLCRRPPPARIRESTSEDEGTHGKKLYWLYAKDRDAYLKVGKGASQPVGQVLVKEAFVAKPGRGDGDPQQDGWRPLTPIVERDGKPFHAGEKQGLYVLLKLDPKTEGSDAGWVYGTLTADGKTVTSAGRVASCMGCHTENTTDRMFGLQKR